MVQRKMVGKYWAKKVLLRYRYRQFKKEIREEIYYNNKAYFFLFRMKSNTLLLNDRNRHKGGSTVCDLCGADLEDLVHFVAECPELQSERNKIMKLQNPQQENKTKVGSRRNYFWK